MRVPETAQKGCRASMLNSFISEFIRNSKALKKLFSILPQQHTNRFKVLIGLSVLGSIAELISLASVVPFLAVLMNPTNVAQVISLDFFDFLSYDLISIELFLTIIFVSITIFAALLRVTLLKYTVKAGFLAGTDLSSSLFDVLVRSQYSDIVAQNSGETIAKVTQKANAVIYNFFIPIFTLISSSIIVAIMFTALILAETEVSVFVIGVMGFFYYFTARITKNRLLHDGAVVSKGFDKIVKYIQDALGSIRDIILDGSQSHISEAYRRIDYGLRRSQARAFFMTQLPKYIMETIGIVVIALSAYVLVVQEGSVSTVPFIGAIALAGQRLLPLVQSIYASWSAIKFGEQALDDVLETFHASQRIANGSEKDEIPISGDIVFEDVWFKHRPEAKWVLKGLSFTIKSGSHVGIVGATGSGKSTVLDLIMGLQRPTKGKILIDGIDIWESGRVTSWQKSIAHVPQSVYLVDGSLKENIALRCDVSQIVNKKLEDAIRFAKLVNVVESFENGLEQTLGENGAFLSGGQKQRIGIARAIYKDSDILILDEATSALDSATETELISMIYENLSERTVIFVSHREASLENCNQIISIEQCRGV